MNNIQSCIKTKDAIHCVFTFDIDRWRVANWWLTKFMQIPLPCDKKISYSSGYIFISRCKISVSSDVQDLDEYILLVLWSGWIQYSLSSLRWESSKTHHILVNEVKNIARKKRGVLTIAFSKIKNVVYLVDQPSKFGPRPSTLPFSIVIRSLCMV